MNALLYSMIAMVAVTLGLSATAADAPTVPMPKRVILITMCKETYGALMVLDNGDVYLFTDPTFPAYIESMKGVPKENIGSLEITPTFPCPVST